MTGPVIVDETKRPGVDRERVLRIVAAGLVLVLLAVFLPKVMGGDGSAGAQPTIDLSSPVTTAVRPSERPTTTTVPPAAGEDRNPFAPLGGGPARTPTTAAPAAPTTTTTAPADRPERFELVEVYRDPAGTPSAKVRLDGTQMTVKSGEDFATSFRTMSLDLEARCGAFLYADRRFSLCVGEGYQL